MAKLCSKCFHREVCVGAKDFKAAVLIDCNGCSQFKDESSVIILPVPVKPGTDVKFNVEDSECKYLVDKVVVYRNESIDIYCKSKVSQGVCVFSPEDFGEEFFLDDGK